MVSIPAETLWQQMAWVMLFVFSLYMFSVYGESIRKGWGTRLDGVIRTVRMDIRVIVMSTVAVVGVVFGVINPLNLGAGFAALVGWTAPVWSFFTTGVMALTNATGITGFGIATIIPIAILVGAFAFALRQRSLLQE